MNRKKPAMLVATTQQMHFHPPRRRVDPNKSLYVAAQQTIIFPAKLMGASWVFGSHKHRTVTGNTNTIGPVMAIQQHVRVIL